MSSLWRTLGQLLLSVAVEMPRLGRTLEEPLLRRAVEMPRMRRFVAWASSLGFQLGLPAWASCLGFQLGLPDRTQASGRLLGLPLALGDLGLPAGEGLGHDGGDCPEHDGGGGGLLAGDRHHHIADGSEHGTEGISFLLVKGKVASVADVLSTAEEESSAWGPAPLRAQDDGPGLCFLNFLFFLCSLDSLETLDSSQDSS